MNRPRVHKVLADLFGNRARSLLVIASITVGLFSIGVMATQRLVISEDMRLGYSAANPANIQISILRPFDEDVVEQAAQISGVRQAQGGRLFSSRLQTGPDLWKAIDLQVGPRHNETWAGQAINQLTLVQGHWPPAKGEIAIEQFKLHETGAQLGDWLTLEAANGQTRRLQLTAVVADQTVGAFTPGPGFFLAPIQGYITPDTAEWLGQAQPERFNLLYLTVTDSPGGANNDEAVLRQVADAVRHDLDRRGIDAASIEVRGSSDHPNRPYIEALSSVLLLLGLLVLFLGGFLITNTLQAIVQHQLQQIGILKTLGARRRQIIVLYMALILLFGLLAALIAVPLAYQVSFARIEPLTAAVNVKFRGPRLVLPAVLLQVLMALVVPQVAALLPILQGAHLSVTEALSGIRQGGQTRRGWLDTRLTRMRLFSRPMLLSLRNTFRRKGRLALTLITLSLGGAIFIATFNIQAAMDKQVQSVSRYFLADVNLTLTQPQRIDEVAALLADIPNLGYVEGWGAARSELVQADGKSGARVQLLAPPQDTRLVDPVLLTGRWVQPGDSGAIVLNERFKLDFPDLAVGDTLTLRVNNRERDWHVVGFFQLAGSNSGYIAYTHYTDVAEATGTLGRAITFRVVAAQPNLSPADQEAMGIAIENCLRSRGITVADVTTGDWIAGSAAQGFAILNNFLLFLAMLTALVGSIGLAGAMSLNVMERTREIGILRAIGATDGILMRLVITEGLLIGMISWLLAALLALPISLVLSNTVSRVLFGNPSALELTPTGFGLWLAAVLLLSALASILPARSAAHLTIREVLAYE